MDKQKKWLLVGCLIYLVITGIHFSYGGSWNQDEEESESSLMNLPDEMWISIICFLSPSEITSVGVVSKHLHALSKNKYLWKQKAIELKLSEVEFRKVKKGFFSYQQIVKGDALWNKFEKIRNSSHHSNSAKLELLIEDAECGNEKAIDYLLNAYEFGWYGLEENNPKGLELAQKHTTFGSENATIYLFWVVWI